MSDPNLLYTDVEDDLRSSVRDLLAKRCPPEAVTAMYDGDRSVVESLWQAVATELGLAGLMAPESAGGAGASAREAAVVLEELGRFAAPVPFLTSSVVATAVLDEDHELLSLLASGRTTAALAVPFGTSPMSPVPTATTSVAGALEADVLLVPVTVDRGVEVHAVEASAARVTPVTSLDMSRQLADVSFDAGSSQVLIPADAGEAAVRCGLQVGAALLASEQLGVAQWCLEATVAYLKERRQFGRVLGSFQALKHRLADMYVLVEQARAVARYAAATLADDDPDQVVAASVAQAYCSEVAVTVAEECVQLHGGIGMTWEHPAHLYLKRAKADQIGLGTPAAHRAHLGELVDLPPA